jgi:hypothetical protein
VLKIDIWKKETIFFHSFVWTAQVVQNNAIQRLLPQIISVQRCTSKGHLFLHCLKNDPKVCKFLPKDKFQHLLLHKAGWIF